MPDRKERRRRHRVANEATRLARKQLKRNRKPDRVRRKDWLPETMEDALAGFDDTPQYERVMPRGERERRRAALNAVLLSAKDDGGDEENSAAVADGRPGTVVEVASSLCRVDVAGREVLCSVRGALTAGDTGLTNVVAVGDEVTVRENGNGRGVVEAVLPRRSVLARPDVFRPHLQQVIAANIDQVLIVASWREPAIWLELIDRYLIGAERNHLLSIICVNKMDLAEDRSACRAALRPYEDLGYRVIYSSAVTGEGQDALRAALAGRTTALAGLSGVGKSTLLSLLQPGLGLRVGEVSAHWHQGRHTTTQVRLVPLDIGGYVVDTPGVREFGLAGLCRKDLERYYPEIVAMAGACRFADCTHTDEPDCAVLAGMRRGKMARTRYESYRKILESLPEA